MKKTFKVIVTLVLTLILSLSSGLHSFVSSAAELNLTYKTEWMNNSTFKFDKISGDLKEVGDYATFTMTPKSTWVPSKLNLKIKAGNEEKSGIINNLDEETLIISSNNFVNFKVSYTILANGKWEFVVSGNGAKRGLSHFVFEIGEPLVDESGDDESGDDESGDDESGDDESGDDESGDDESGDDESGDDESGDDESGDDESGDDESGDVESGDDESGDDESGDDESGDDESGDDESGDDESGDDESGDNEIINDDNEEEQVTTTTRRRSRVAVVEVAEIELPDEEIAEALPEPMMEEVVVEETVEVEPIEEIILDEAIAEALPVAVLVDEELPQTGGVPLEAFSLLGVALTSIGAALRKRNS